jgi:hypothetical protein
MFIGDFCEREQSASRAASQYDTLHNFLSYRNEFQGAYTWQICLSAGQSGESNPSPERQ